MLLSWLLLLMTVLAAGFLAALPAGRAEETLAALHRVGIQAARIGMVTQGPPRITAR